MQSQGEPVSQDESSKGSEVTSNGGTSSNLVRKAANGAAALAIRQGLVYGSNIAGGVVLARLLTPSEFGFYGIVLFLVAFLNIFGGTGLASNLIRTESQATLEDYRAVFTAQQIVVVALFLSIWIAAPSLGSAYHLHHGSSFFRLIGLALVFTSLMVIPQVQMERELAFQRLAIVETVQAVIFNLVCIVLAWRGFGVLSFSIALAIRAGSGAILSNLMEPWHMGWRWDTDAFSRHLSYGVALQGSQILSMAKDSITPVFVGLFLGATQMGYVTWANTLAGYPVMILMPLQRLYLPLFARLQSDRKELSRFVSHALWMANAIAAPLAVTTIALAHPITTIIFGSKWLVALPIFYCFSSAIFFSPCSTPMLGVLNALGKSHLTLAMTAIWMIGTWVFGVPLILKFGLFGFGAAIILVHLTNLILYWMVWKELAVSPWPSYVPSWPLAAAVGLALMVAQHFHPIRHIVELTLYGVCALAVYGAILWFGFPKHTRAWARLFRRVA